jgi:hypothetical protein
MQLIGVQSKAAKAFCQSKGILSDPGVCEGSVLRRGLLAELAISRH